MHCFNTSCNCALYNLFTPSIIWNIQSSQPNICQSPLYFLAKNWRKFLFCFFNVINVCQFFREEREKYYSHRNKAKENKEKYLCVIIDGMDQMKLLVPNLLHVMKAYSSAWKLKTHLTGVLNHGRETLGFFDLHQWPHDSNLTINVLLRVLVKLDNIPDILYLQMDNCWRENKNQYIIVFLAVLVHLGIFKKV